MYQLGSIKLALSLPPCEMIALYILQLAVRLFSLSNLRYFHSADVNCLGGAIWVIADR